MRIVLFHHDRRTNDIIYLIEQLPIQKHQKYLEGLEAAALAARAYHYQVDISDTNATHGLAAEERIKELEQQRDRLREIAARLEVLAVKWVDASHHDWPEIKQLSKALEETT